jgi:hypothetical protein
MKVSLYTLVAPRIEYSFVEEWIAHYLSLGVSKIYIYNNGYELEPSKITKHDRTLSKQRRRTKSKHCRELKTNKVWWRKPDVNMSLELSDSEVTEKLQSTCAKYKEVELIDWVSGEDHDDVYPKSQVTGYKNCVNTFNSDWWLFLDIDEFLVFRKHSSIQNFLSDQDQDLGTIRFRQRVFEQRVIGAPVRSLYNRSDDDRTFFQPKTLVKAPIKTFHVHKALSAEGSVLTIDESVAVNHHYRGNAACVAWGELQFDTYDDSMKQYL